MTPHDLDNQIIFKLGAIESQVTSLGVQMRDNFHKLSERINETTKAHDQEIAKLETHVIRNKEEIQRLKDWKNTVVSKVMGGASVVALVWVVIGELFTDAVGRIF